MSTADYEKRIIELNLTLPPIAKALGAYKPVVEVGLFAVTSGTLSVDRDGKIVAGRVGAEATLADGQHAARLATLNALAALRGALGSLNRIEAVVRVVGHILTTPDFQDHAPVMDGASTLLAEVFGAKGRHARLSLGAQSLPKGATIELEMLVALRPPG